MNPNDSNDPWQVKSENNENSRQNLVQRNNPNGIPPSLPIVPKSNKMIIPVRGYNSANVPAANANPKPQVEIPKPNVMVLRPNHPPIISEFPPDVIRTEEIPPVFNNKPISFPNPANNKSSAFSNPFMKKANESANIPMQSAVREKIEIPHRDYKKEPPKLKSDFASVPSNPPLRPAQRIPNPINRAKPLPSNTLQHFEVTGEVKAKIAGFISAFPDLDPGHIQTVIIENQGCTEDELYIKLTTPVIAPQVIPQMYDPKSFKVFPCQEKINCRTANCIFFHSLGEKRRFPINYSEKLCKEYPKCQQGESCKLAHNSMEVAYHPHMVNKLSCPMETCPWGRTCPFFHANQGKVSLRDRLKQVLSDSKSHQSNLISQNSQIINNLESKILLKKSLEQRLNCGECKKIPGNIINIPCGHLSCSTCAISHICPVCGIASKSIQGKSGVIVN